MRNGWLYWRPGRERHSLLIVCSASSLPLEEGQPGGSHREDQARCLSSAPRRLGEHLPVTPTLHLDYTGLGCWAVVGASEPCVEMVGRAWSEEEPLAWLQGDRVGGRAGRVFAMCRGCRLGVCKVRFQGQGTLSSSQNVTDREGLVTETFIAVCIPHQVFRDTLGTQWDPVSALVFCLAMTTVFYSVFAYVFLPHMYLSFLDSGCSTETPQDPPLCSATEISHGQHPRGLLLALPTLLDLGRLLQTFNNPPGIL